MAIVVGQADARAECTAPTPACHLDTGKALLTTDPKRAADELLASYKLDERTDTLELYATALALDHRYALALETWKRVIVFRDSELEAAKETARGGGRKAAAARKAAARAEKQSEQAAEALMKLWPSVGRVRVRLAPGQQVAVTRDGAEVDVAQDIVVNAGHDELVFTRKDGSVERVAVAVAAGASTKIDAPADTAGARKPPVEAIARRAPEPAPVGKPAPAAEPAPVEASEQASVVVTARAEPAAAPGSHTITMSRVGLGLIAGAVVAGGVAGGFEYVAHRDYDRAQSAGCTGGRCPFGPAADLAHQSNERARVAQFTAIGAGVLAATGVTLWFFGRRAEHRAVSDIALHVGPSSTAISGRF